MDGDVANVTPKKWWPRFFDALRSSGIVSASAESAGIDRRTVYRYKRDCPEFAAQWEEAEKEAVGRLEDIATERAATSSDTLLIFLLKTRAREKYAEVIKTEHSGAVAIGSMNLDNCDTDELRLRLARAAEALLPR